MSDMNVLDRQRRWNGTAGDDPSRSIKANRVSLQHGPDLKSEPS